MPPAKKTAPKKTASKKAAPKKAAPKKAAPKVRLLTGGNPQIAKADGDAPVQKYIAALPGWKRAVGATIDAVVTRTVPGVQKAVKWNSPMYGVAGQGYFLSVHAFTRHVKATFFKGASLTPLPPGESSSPDVRVLDIHEGETIDEAQLARWVKQAASIPGWSPGR